MLKNRKIQGLALTKCRYEVPFLLGNIRIGTNIMLILLIFRYNHLFFPIKINLM